MNRPAWINRTGGPDVELYRKAFGAKAGGEK